jgi:hypothetical protein
MIIDIDNLSSVESFMSKISSDWFDIDRMYYDLKSDLQINWTNFWNITGSMINIISNCLECTSEEFLRLWEKKCTDQRVMFMGYHCTRHRGNLALLYNMRPDADGLKTAPAGQARR